VILARELVKGEDTLLFRDAKGTPVWDARTGQMNAWERGPHETLRTAQSMSSIKRDVKKKVLPRPEARRFGLESSPLSVSAPRLRSKGFALACLPFCGFISVVTTPIESRTGQADLVLECQPWFYRRLVAYRYFWLSEEAYV